MIFDISVAIAIILFLALFPMAFIWLRRAWRIFIQHDYSEVALKGGLTPANPKKWAPVTGGLNLLAGMIALWILVGVPLAATTGISLGLSYEFEDWSAIAGSTIWIKLIADFIVGRQAHPIVWGRKKNPQP